MISSTVSIKNPLVVSILEKCQEIIDKSSYYFSRNKVYVPTDSEWDGEYITDFDNWIQTANPVFYLNEDDIWTFHIFIFTTDKLSEYVKYKISSEFSDDKITLVYGKVNQTEYIERFIEDRHIKPKVIQLVMKYSPLDLQAYFGNETWYDILTNRIVEQKRCLRFNNKTVKNSKRKYKPNSSKFNYEIRDLQGLNTSGLDKQGISVGVHLLAKNTMNEYKSNMMKGYEEKPVEATAYCCLDAIQELEIVMAYIPLINNIITKDIGLPDTCQIDESTLRHTTGALNGDVLTKYIEYYPYTLNPNIDNNDLDVWRLALRRYSILRSDLNERGYKLGSEVLQGMKKCDTLNDYKEYTIYYPEGNKSKKKAKNKYDKANYISLYDAILNEEKSFFDNLVEYNTYQQSCVRSLGNDPSKSLVYNAIVQGGRCNNSTPYESKLEYTLDIDLNSCYGSTLRTLHYPIGLPSTIYHDLNQVNDKLLFETLDKLKDNVENDLWIADVSTVDNLSFDIDLIYSTINVTPEKINKNVGGSHYDEEGFEVEEDVKKIPSDFVLARRNLVHSKIGSFTIELIKKVASNTELGEIKRKFGLNSIIYYDKQHQSYEPIEWALKVLSDKGEITQSGNNKKDDTRSRYWFALPLEGYIGKLVDIRKVAKKKAKQSDVSEKSYWTAYQEMLKLFINVTYGDLASVYFPFGNTVLANVITDKARGGAWMLSKCLHTRMEITDGGFYTPLSIPFLGDDSRKPGFHILADCRRWEYKRSGYKRTIESLGNKDWISEFNGYSELLLKKIELENTTQSDNTKEEIEELTKLIVDWNSMIDKVAENHIKEFWGKYNLELPFTIEHKYEHTSWKAGYLNKSDYYFECVNGTSIFKKRGAKLLSEDKLEQGYVNDPSFKLLEMLANDDTSEYENKEYHVGRIIKVGEWIEAKPDSQVKQLMPGAGIICKREARQMNNKHIYMPTTNDWEKINKRRGIFKGSRVEWFERNVKNHKKMIKRMNENIID